MSSLENKEVEPVEPVQINIYQKIPIEKTSAGYIWTMNQGFNVGSK